MFKKNLLIKENYMRKNKAFLLKSLSTFFLIILLCSTAGAAPIPMFNNEWTEFAGEDWVGKNGYLGPGWGGQAFDAEYLFYKIDKNNLSIGLQTGYDVIDGTQYTYNNRSRIDYYAGDLALSFDGDASSYEYAIDFGLLTKDYYGDKVGNFKETTGIDPAGLYRVTDWNNDIAFNRSSPFAMESGSLVGNLIDNDSGYEYYGSGKYDYSVYRIVTIGLDDLAGIIGNELTLDAHWTMSCGNDAIAGQFTETVSAPVPEPSTLLLIGLGSAGLLIARRFSKK